MLQKNVLQKIGGNHYTPYVLYAFFVLAIVIHIIFITRVWRGDWELSHQPLTQMHLAGSRALVRDDAQLIENISQSHLFGQVLENVSDMPISNLELHLTGIVHGKNGENAKDAKNSVKSEMTQSKAYIVIDNQPAKIYSIGDTLPIGAKIYAITEDTVILQNRDRLEKLTLSRTPLAFKANPKVIS